MFAPAKCRRSFKPSLLLQLLEPAQDWHATSVGGKGFLINELGTQSMCSTYSYKEQDGEIDTTSGTGSALTQLHLLVMQMVMHLEGAKQTEGFPHPCILRFPSLLTAGTNLCIIKGRGEKCLQ